MWFWVFLTVGALVFVWLAKKCYELCVAMRFFRNADTHHYNKDLYR